MRQLIERGASVKAIYRSTPSTLLTQEENNQIEWLEGDILDVSLLNSALRDVDQVYHAAAIVSFHPARRKELFRINIEGTANVINAAIEQRVKKLVHVSSVSAMGRLRNDFPVNETMYWTEETSNSKYGQSKYLSELEVWRGIAEGLNAVIVNPTVILGPGDWSNGSSKIFKSAYEEFPWYTEGSGGFVDVRDVVNAMILLMESEIHSERFIVSAENRSYKEIFSLIAAKFGKRPPHKKVSSFLTSLVWRAEWMKSLFGNREPLLTRETAATARVKVDFDNTKLKNFLPTFKYITVEQSIADSCNELVKRYKLL